MIKSIKAKKILNSRKELTIEASLKTENGVFKASIPSGASTGEKEAIALNANRAAANINNTIGFKLSGEDEIKQEKIDKIMIDLDGTENKSKLGANAILAISIAVCRAGAAAQNLLLHEYISKIYRGRASVILPKPCFNIINGGAHARNKLEIQEFMIIPDYNNFADNLKIGKKVFNNLKKILEKKFGKKGIKMGDEGGFAPPIENDKKSLDYISEAIGKDKVEIGLDCAASQFYSEGNYNIDNKALNKNELLDFYKQLVGQYPIIFIEDPFAQDDWLGWQEIIKDLGDKITIIGDDLLATNAAQMKIAWRDNACNGAIIKPNQIGTVSETLGAIKLARSYGWKIVVSHRSGETMDNFIADLAVGAGADFIKSGAPSKPERLSKYNRLVKIEKYG
ncbi:MAG: enolase [bacterium]|nr:enolase [bacterium]